MAEGNSAPGGDNRRLTFFDIFSEVTGMETVDLSGLLKKGSGNGEGSEGWLSLSNAMTESGKSSSDDSDNKKPDGGSTSSAAYTYTAYGAVRSEEHTSELQSRENLVCRLLLEKK